MQAVPTEKCLTGQLVTTGEPLYEAACQFTRESYEKRLGCELEAFFPRIFVLSSEDGILGVCGIRAADDETLFLEQYLDEPIQQHLEDTCRGAIVELGGFAARSRFEALLLMGYLAQTLSDEGYKKVACTANLPVRQCLRKLGVPFIEISAADPRRVQAADKWGDYYQTSPLVLVGDIGGGLDAIRQLRA
ncbi:MAG: thermostable hemolysin [Pseudomonadales bacterium]|nr:thermostable hemolysin [Pseudomonadales bacterium]